MNSRPWQSWVLWVLVVLIGCATKVTSSSSAATGAAVCVDRRSINIVTATHGGPSDPFWVSERSAAVRATPDLHIQSRYITPDVYTVPALGALLLAVGVDAPRVQALVVSLPSAALLPFIQSTLQDLTTNANSNPNAFQIQIPPIAIINGGVSLLQNVSSDAIYVGQVDFNLGFNIGKSFIQHGVSKGLCMDHAAGGNVGVLQRCQGLDAAFRTINSSAAYLIVPPTNAVLIAQYVTSTLQGDLNIGGLFTPGPVYTPVRDALQAMGRLGHMQFATTFSASQAPDILTGSLTLATSQSQYLQTWVPIVLATLRLGTGHHLTLPNSRYETGPVLVTSANVGKFACFDQGLVYCSDSASDQATHLAPGCACVDRGGKRIFVVTQAQSQDLYWQLLQSGLDLASIDSNVTFVHLHPTVQEINDQANAMGRYMQQAVLAKPHAILMTLPFTTLPPWVDAARAQGIAVFAFQAGRAVALQKDIRLYVGPDDVQSGQLAGAELLRLIRQRNLVSASSNNGVVFCLNHQVGTVAFDDRCRGLVQGLNDSTLLLTVVVLSIDERNPTSSQQVVQTAIQTATTSGLVVVGIQTVGYAGFSVLLALRSTTPTLFHNLTTGIFDVLDETALQAFENEQLDVIIDSQPFAAGYLAAMLTTSHVFLDVEPIANHVLTGARLFRQEDVAWRRQELLNVGWARCLDPVNDTQAALEEERLRQEAFQAELRRVASIVVPDSVQRGVFGLATLAGVIGLGALVFVLIHRRDKVFMAASVLFCCIFLSGCVLICVSAALQVLSQNTNASCQLKTVLFHIGIDMVLGSQIVKTRRLNHIFNNAVIRTLKLPDRRVVSWLLALMSLDAILLITWSQVAAIDELEPLVCKHVHDGPNAILEALLWTYKAILTGYLCFLAFRVRNTPTEFNETTALTAFVVNLCFFGVIAILFTYLMPGSTMSVQRELTAFTLCLASLAAICIMFGINLWSFLRLRLKVTNGNSMQSMPSVRSHNYCDVEEDGKGEGGASPTSPSGTTNGTHGTMTTATSGIGDVLDARIKRADEAMETTRRLLDEETARHTARMLVLNKEFATHQQTMLRAIRTNDQRVPRKK